MICWQFFVLYELNPPGPLINRLTSLLKDSFSRRYSRNKWLRADYTLHRVKQICFAFEHFRLLGIYCTAGSIYFFDNPKMTNIAISFAANEFVLASLSLSWKRILNLKTIYVNYFDIYQHFFRAGNLLMGFLSETLVFYKKMSEWAIRSKKWSIRTKKMSDSLICSFLVSDLSDSLTSLIFGERPERFAHQKWGNEQIAHFFNKKNYIKYTKK